MGNEPRLRRGHSGLEKFFVCWASSRHDANISLVAGTIAGCLITLVLAYSALLMFIRGEYLLRFTAPLFAAAALATFGTWRGNLLSTVVVEIIGAGTIGYLIRLLDIASAVILFVPFICGPITAARGAYVLDRMRRGARIE